jgi:hypothetical protein
VLIARRSPIAATLCLALIVASFQRSFAQPVGSEDETDTPAVVPTAHAGKPVPFDHDWLEPFFQRGAAKAAAEKFRADDWSGAEAGFARALKSLPRHGDERLAATYLLALARANQSNWGDASMTATRSWRPTTPTTPPAAGCGAATTRARSSGQPRCRRGASPSPRPT